ncbi:MAG: C40 family peptidase [Bacteroidales bacterium]|jgi:hypothetical protein|nr:C40 family peptidase [Bacteroidales bacterium]
MKNGICTLSVVPIRAMPADKSELVSELLFGELFEVREVVDSWINIKTVYDGYEGWVDIKQCTLLSDDEFEKHLKNNQAVTTELVQIIYNKTNKIYYPVLIGSSLPSIVDTNLCIAGNEYIYEGEYTRELISKENRKIPDVAKQLYNAPYRWGGRTPFGIDCSGFTQLVMKICGITILRDASQQATQGEAVNFISEAVPGDLAFFENEENLIVHTGIILNNQKIIHASGNVRIDDIDHEGIYNGELNKYTHKLRIIRRFI